MRLVREFLAALILLSCLFFGAPSAQGAASYRQAQQSNQAAARANLTSIKKYMVQKTQVLLSGVIALQAASNAYYTLAKTAEFRYTPLWRAHPTTVWTAINRARTAWTFINPLYEQMEGIVAGLPKLATYDLILDSGTAGTDGGGSVAPFDITLPSGKRLSRPGNLYGITESALWGTYAPYTVPGLWADFNGNGKQDFAETLPDANVLKGASDAFVFYVTRLLADEQRWQPTLTDAFNCLILNVPTMADFFNVWRNSRFVMGDKATEHDFVVRSRLGDIVDNVSSWQVLYQGLSPLVHTVDAGRDTLVHQELTDLRLFVSRLWAREQSGAHFTPEEANLLGAEAQNRATAITGQIVQVAGELHVAVAG